MDRYHHGDLRSALVRAGLELARQEGVDALGMRELTRIVGVSPNAAYRHFPSRRALVLTVADAAQHELSRSILDAMTVAGEVASPSDRASERLRAFCMAYIGFAVAEPGWFALTCESQEVPPAPPLKAQPGLPPPHQLLLDALDSMVAAGAMNRYKRVDAEWSCWSTAHGFAVLTTSGPLQSRPTESTVELARTVVDTLIVGLRT